MVYYNDKPYEIGDVLVCEDDLIHAYHITIIVKQFEYFVCQYYVYTIREIQQLPDGRVAVLLNEIVNPKTMMYQGIPIEPGFDLRRFRKTTIEEVIENNKKFEEQVYSKLTDDLLGDLGIDRMN